MEKETSRNGVVIANVWIALWLLAAMVIVPSVSVFIIVLLSGIGIIMFIDCLVYLKNK